MFVTLAHGVTARVKLGQLAASYVEDPEAVFPPGTLVKGRILSVQADRSASVPQLEFFFFFFFFFSNIDLEFLGYDGLVLFAVPGDSPASSHQFLTTSGTSCCRV